MTDIDRKSPAAQAMSFTETIRADVEVGGGAKAMAQKLFGRWLDMCIRSRTQRAKSAISELLQAVPDEVLHRAGYQRRQPGATRNTGTVDDA